MHEAASEYAGQTVKLGELKGPSERDGLVAGADYRVEDWWDRISGQSWRDSNGNPAAMKYAVRIGTAGAVLPDDEVLYGKIAGFGHIVHVSELA